MRLALALSFLTLLAGALCAGDAVPLADFARRHRLTSTRDAVSGRDVLRGGSTVIVCTGMSVALVDGRAVNLDEPARVEDGRTVLSSADADRLGSLVRAGAEFPEAPEYRPDPAPAPKPLVVVRNDSAPPRPAAAAKKTGRFKTVVIDPGHGGVHTGGKGARGTTEKEIVLHVSKVLRDRLEAEGVRVLMTRETDRHLAPEVRADLDARVEFTERHDPDLFISVHANWAENKGAQGFEIFYPRAGCAASAAERQASKRLAETIQGIFAKRFDTPDRGVKEAGFFVIKNAPCPSVLVELDFVSNLASEKKLREASYREKLADAVADAVLAEHRR